MTIWTPIRMVVSSVLQYALLMCVVNLTACGIDRQSVAPDIEPSKLLRNVQMEYQAYNLSMVKPYDTVSLKTRGISGTGSVIDVPVVYTYDSRYVTVNADGLLQVTAPTSRTTVTATMSYGGSTRVATAIVGVIATPPRHLARIAIEPNPGDSTKSAIPGPGAQNLKSMRLIRVDSSDATVSEVLVSLWSSDLAVAKIAQSGNNVTATPVRPGQTVFHVSAYAYGIGFHDSLTFTVGWPLMAILGTYTRIPTGSTTPVLALTTGRITVGIGACVVWFNPSTELGMDIVFDDATHVFSPDSATTIARTLCVQYGRGDTASNGAQNGGNVAPFHRVILQDGREVPFSWQRARAFTQPGVYTYRSERYGFVGTIVVCDERNDPTCAPEHFQWRALNQ